MSESGWTWRPGGLSPSPRVRQSLGADAGRTRGGRRHETETDGAVARARPGLGEAGRPPTAQEPLRGLAWRRAAKAAAGERRAAGRGLRGGVGRPVPAFAVTLGDPTVCAGGEGSQRTHWDSAACARNPSYAKLVEKTRRGQFGPFSLSGVT